MAPDRIVGKITHQFQATSPITQKILTSVLQEAMKRHRVKPGNASPPPASQGQRRAAAPASSGRDPTVSLSPAMIQAITRAAVTAAPVAAAAVAPAPASAPAASVTQAATPRYNTRYQNRKPNNGQPNRRWDKAQKVAQVIAEALYEESEGEDENPSDSQVQEILIDLSPEENAPQTEQDQIVGENRE